MSDVIPTAGRIVNYILTADDAIKINRRRTSAQSIFERISAGSWPVGAQAHIGNSVTEGDVYPMLIVRVWGDEPTSGVNGQVFLDGNDAYWATSVHEGVSPGQFSWPTRG